MMKIALFHAGALSLLLVGCATDSDGLSKENFDEQAVRIVKKIPFQDNEYDAKRKEEQDYKRRGNPSVADSIVIGLTALAISGGHAVAFSTSGSGERETKFPPRFVYTLKLSDGSSMRLMEAYDIFKEGECVRLLRGQTSGLYRLATGYTGSCDGIPK